MSSTATTSLASAESPVGDGAALRGLAILGIVLHNYSHLLRGIVTENEYSFVAKYPEQLLYHLQHPTLYLPLQLLSFFGHYGVSLFLFLSAYGLEKKYAASQDPVPAGKFVLSHYAKLAVMMLFGYLPFLILDSLAGSGLRIPLPSLLAQLTMVNTLFPFERLMVYPGPYWYFALMVQIYLVYRLFLFRRPWPWAVALLLLCQLAQYLVSEDNITLMWLRYNFIGSMLPFVLGLLYARYGRPLGTGTTALLALLTLVGIFVGSFSFASWLWVPALVCVVGLALLQLLPQPLLRPLAWLGSISSAVFILHPLVRFVVLPNLADSHYLGLAIYTLVTVLGALLLQPWMNRALRWVAGKF